MPVLNISCLDMLHRATASFHNGWHAKSCACHLHLLLQNSAQVIIMPQGKIIPAVLEASIMLLSATILRCHDRHCDSGTLCFMTASSAHNRFATLVCVAGSIRLEYYIVVLSRLNRRVYRQ